MASLGLAESLTSIRILVTLLTLEAFITIALKSLTLIRDIEARYGLCPSNDLERH